MFVLVLNCGSSSIKYQVLDTRTGAREAVGLVERVTDHQEGLRAVMEKLGPTLERVGAVGHRVVHGGEVFSEPTLIDDEVLATIESLSHLAPLHNPANIAGIRAARAALPGVPQVAVFDTAFHQTLPPAASTYAVPAEWGVRKYGFHGTSHAYVSREAARILGKPYAEMNSIVLHLGNGASAAAVRGGRSVDTSMGLTPLAGLVMGTRSGDVDPALPAFVARQTGLSLDKIDDALNRESGLRALSGENDLREVWRLVDEGDERAKHAVEVYAHRIKSYVGAYYAVLGQVDAVIFTAGVGENDLRMRELALDGLERLGVAVDAERNRAKETVISPEGSPVTVLVIPTNEELEIATQAAEVAGRAA